jgi:hypothetical protein
MTIFGLEMPGVLVWILNAVLAIFFKDLLQI